MRRTTKKLVLLMMLTGIAGMIGVAALKGSFPSPAPVPPTPDVTFSDEGAAAAQPVALRTEAAPAAPRVSVSFNDEDQTSYALLKGVPPHHKPASRAGVDVWYGQYSEQDYRPLPASPVEKEPSRLNVKVSIAF